MLQASRISSSIASLFRLISIRRRLIAFFVLLSSVPIIILGIFSYTKSSNAVESKIEFFSSEMFNQSAQNIRLKMNTIEYSFAEFKNNRDAMAYVKKYSSDKSSLRVVLTSLNRILNSKFIDSIVENCLGSYLISDGEIIGTSGPYQVLRSINITEEHINRAREAKGTSVWMTEVLEDTNETYLLVLTQLYDNYSSNELGTLIILLDQNYFSDTFNTVNFTENSDLFIINSEGLIFSSNDTEKMPISTKYTNMEVINEINRNVSQVNNSQDTSKKFQTVSGTVKSQLNGSKYIYFYSTIENTDWYIVGTIPYDFLTKDSMDIGLTILEVGVVIFILAILLSIIVSMSILAPLNKLEDYMESAKNGDLSVSIGDKHTDEISGLSNYFDEMIKNIRNLVSKVRESSELVLKSAGDVTKLSSLYLSSSEQIAQSMSQIAIGTSEQADNSSNAVNFVNELSDDINKVEENVELSTKIIGDTKALSENAMQAIELLNQKSVHSGSVTEEIVNNINTLNTDIK